MISAVYPVSRTALERWLETMQQTASRPVDLLDQSSTSLRTSRGRQPLLGALLEVGMNASQYPDHLDERIPAPAGACWLSASAVVLLLWIFSTPVLAQPRATVSVDHPRPRVNQPFRLVVEVRWEGPPDRYTLYPPKLELPEAIRQGAVRQHYTTLAGETRFRYEFELVASLAGSYDLGKATIDYRDMRAGSGEGESPALEPRAPRVNVMSAGLKGHLGSVMVPLLAVIAIIGALYWRRRRPAPSPEQPLAPKRETQDDILERARNYLTSGDIDRVYNCLIELKPLLPREADPLPSDDKLEAERLRAKYGGASSGKDEATRLLRSVEVLVKPSRHDTRIEDNR